MSHSLLIGQEDGRWTMTLGSDRAQAYDCLEAALDDVGQVVFELDPTGTWGARVRPPRRR